MPILIILLSNMSFLHPMLLPMYKAFYLQSMPHQLRFFVRPSFINQKMVQAYMPGGKRFGFGRRLAHWPPQSGAESTKAAYEGASVYGKKIDTQKVYLCQRVRGITCAWQLFHAHACWQGDFSDPPPLVRTPLRHRSTPLSRICNMSDVLDSATPK